MKTILPLILSLSPMAFAGVNPDLPDPSVLTKEYLEQMSARVRGQTTFIVKNQVWSQEQQPQQQQQQQQQQDSQTGANRDIQESDVYKIGNPARSELFLLNNYRGFQVVSFEDGIAKPKLVARLPIYNNWGAEMYYLASQDKVLILNTEWSYISNDWSSNYSTKIYLVDVANSLEPKIVNEIKLDGYLQETRMVGDVLYTITHNGSSEKKMKITSVKLGYGDMETIDESVIEGTDRYVQTMNVVKENNKYYVISTLTNWNMQGDLINVHDISSPNGKIQKLFTAQARGRVLERSQTFMHKGHLFAVSNYSENNRPARISVESYPIAKTSEVVSSKPKNRISVGDTNGLNASLQDVRVSGDQLYAFWVPANNMDPFELFDISKPQDGIKHLGQLQFDGWISKAFPLEHEGKKYVLGLGWVNPATNENGRRLPQAKLFEIKDKNGTLTHEVVASLSITSEEIWASFNDEDKFFEVMSEAPGKFNILFPVTYWKTWKSGAKVVTLDLATKTLGEGASVQGQQGWLKRVFTNKDVNALHAFSNERLENFEHSKLGMPGLAKTVSVLELARNILSFHAVSPKEGVQVVDAENSMEVRKVSLSNVDSELSDVLDMVKIPGSHSWHKVKNDKLYAVTTFYTPRTENDYYWNRKFSHAKLNVLDLKTGELVSSKIDIKIENDEYYYLNLRNVSSENEELFIIGEEFFRLKGTELVKFKINPDCEYFFDNESGNLSLSSIGKDILAFNSFKLTVEEKKFAYYMPFFKVLDFDADKVTCSRSINVPGMPVLADRDFIVTSEDMDDWYDYRYGGEIEMKGGYRPYWPRYRSSSKTTALRLEDTGARLTDYLKRNITDTIFPKGFVTYESDTKLLNIWSLDEDGEFMTKPLYLDYQNNDSNVVSVKTFDARSFIFMQDRTSMDLFEITGGKKIREVPLQNNKGFAPYSIQEITASKDLKSFYLSQGMYGVSELKTKQSRPI